ncbi:MAG: hypothetical protein KKE00_13465 [Proteobacteria bacterium]|nr:hypothetical protein [Pseudomonadota bacterium]MBU1571498.1 hypothetical protein [Pseudomonadota bacterium]
MLNYDIPSRKDIQKIAARLDNLETLIKNTCVTAKARRTAAFSGRGTTSGEKPVKTAFEMVFGVIKGFDHGADFAKIQAKTGFSEKKIRNIIFRLNKFGKIKRKSRGTYVAV